jgi:hypothetical protein
MYRKIVIQINLSIIIIILNANFDTYMASVFANKIYYVYSALSTRQNPISFSST